MLHVAVVSGTLFPLLNIILVVQAENPPITCSAGTVTEGESASISCDFKTNASAVDRGIGITKYPRDEPTGLNGEDVLLCSWSKDTKTHDCSIEMAGYTFDGSLTDHLTVRIPEVLPEHDGWYMCFYLPSHGTEAYPCQLHVRARPENTSIDEAEEDLNWVAIVVPCALGLVALMGTVVVVVICVRRRRRQRTDDEQSVPMLQIRSKTIEEHLQPFTLTKTTLQQVVNVMMSEMKKGLDGSTRLEADIKMFPTCLTHLPDGSESGFGLVLDFDGKQLQASLIQLDGQAIKVRRQKQYEMPADNKKLFYSMADCTNKLIKELTIQLKTLPLVFLVAFPCNNEALDTACQTGKVLVNQALCSLLDTALAERRKDKPFTPSQYDNLNKLKIVAVVNDAAGTLMSVAHTNCRIALTVGSGFSACFVENLTHPETDNPEADKPLEMIINTELGALGEKGCLEFCRTEFDTELDEQSDNPGSQIDKEAPHQETREVQFKLDKEEPYQDTREVQYKPYREEAYQKTRQVLDRLGVKNYTDHDVESVQLVCRYVCERVAFLSAASLAALINHVDQPEVTVVVDGYLYHRHPRFHDLMYSKTLELVTPGLKFRLVSPCHPRCVGAARIAVASLG